MEPTRPSPADRVTVARGSFGNLDRQIRDNENKPLTFDGRIRSVKFAFGAFGPWWRRSTTRGSTRPPTVVVVAAGLIVGLAKRFGRRRARRAGRFEHRALHVACTLTRATNPE